jgi:hypothetical protein
VIFTKSSGFIGVSACRTADHDNAGPLARRLDQAPTFLLRLRGAPGVNSTHALRAVLKRLLRDHGLKCIAIREVRNAP